MRLAGGNHRTQPLPPLRGAMAFFLALAVFLIPFNGFTSHPAFGEFQSELAFFIFFPLVAALLPSSRFVQSRLFWLALFMAVVLAVSTLLNLNDIMAATLRGRSGFNKFATSLIVLLFMMLFAETLERLLCHKGTLLRLVVRPTLYCTVLLLALAGLELVTWYSGTANMVYEGLMALLRPGADANPGRLNTVSFEPSVFSLYLAFSLVFMLGLRGFFPPRWKPWAAYVLIPLTVVTVLLSNGRTGIINTVLVLAMHGILLVVLRRPVLGRQAALLLTLVPPLVLLSIHVLLFVNYASVVNSILGSVSISNLSRFAAIATCLEIFKQHPFFGAGLGQYAFNAERLMPVWGWYSPEVQLAFDPAPDVPVTWPPAHSFFMRLAAELGVFGLLAYFGSLSFIVWKMACKMLEEKRRTHAYPWVAHTFLLGWVFVCFAGIAYDSYRQFVVWIFIACMLAYARLPQPESTFTGQEPAAKS